MRLEISDFWRLEIVDTLPSIFRSSFFLADRQNIFFTLIFGANQGLSDGIEKI